jgi:hypothetical protein
VAGYQLFKNSGCVACHNGAAAGGTTFQKMGVVEPYKTDNPAEGRFAVTGIDADRFNFKVPTLRNVELTYPYFHDGAAWTLAEAVDTMGRMQLGKKFTDEENAQIVAFLKSMTGDQPSFALPILPPSTDKTPQHHAVLPIPVLVELPGNGADVRLRLDQLGRTRLLGYEPVLGAHHGRIVDRCIAQLRECRAQELHDRHLGGARAAQGGDAVLEGQHAKRVGIVREFRIRRQEVVQLAQARVP